MHKSINSIPLLMNGILIKCRLWLIDLKIDIRTKEMLNITPSKK